MTLLGLHNIYFAWERTLNSLQDHKRIFNIRGCSETSRLPEGQGSLRWSQEVYEQHLYLPFMVDYALILQIDTILLAVSG